MATLFEPSASLRAPYSSVHEPYHADLPSINFGFDDLRDRMAKFTTKFDAFIEAGRKRVLEERNQFLINVTELREDDAATRKRIEALEGQISAHAQTLSREAAETTALEAEVASLQSARTAHATTKDSLAARTAEVNTLIAIKQSAQQAQSLALQAQTRQDIPELDFWTANLGMTIEGAGASGKLKFVFSMIDERDWTKDAWFELDLREREYKVRKWAPKVEKERIDGLLTGLNEGRRLGPFLKGLRSLFVEYCRENEA